jgi:hypothetical protein
MKFHHGQQLQGGDSFDDAKHAAARAEGRESAQETEPTQAMIDTLMRHVRNQFYADWPEKKWLQERHGATNEIRYFPAYFEHAVKSWFVHHGEDLYEERKSIRNALDLRFLKGLKQAAPTGPDPMEVLAKTNAVLATTRRRPKTQKIDDQQPDLFSI